MLWLAVSAKPLRSRAVQQMSVRDNVIVRAKENTQKEVAMTARLALCILVAVGGMSQSSVARPFGGDLGVFQLWQEELRLLDEQLAEIKELRFEMRLDEIEKRALVETAELELAREMEATHPDEERVMHLFEDVHKARMELERIHVRNRLRMTSILTETQELALRRLLNEQRTEGRGAPLPRRPPR
jgi:Spy/CpxP family protein refolding chaperone